MVAHRNTFYVPWPDVSEWVTVKEQIFSSDIRDIIKAYETILMWKLKFDSVPAYIECTYTILQVMVKEYMTKNEFSLFSEYDLQLSYSTALIRFVNHISSISSYKGETLYLAAKTQNIPDWIISMRHDVAHGQDLPTLDALHIAADLSLKWLLDNYWSNPEHCEEKPLDISQVDMDSGLPCETDADAQNFFRKVFEVWELCHYVNGKSMQFIAEVDREFVLHTEEMLTLNYMYFNKLENDAIDKIKCIVDMYNHDEQTELEEEILCTVKEFKSLLMKTLKNIIVANEQLKQSLVFALLQTTFLLEKDFSPLKWKSVLCLLQEIGAFSLLLQNLLQMAGKGHRGAIKWLSILPPSIKLVKKQWAMFKVLKKENKNFKTKLLKKKVVKSIRLKQSLPIKLGIFKPPVITLDMMKGVLLNPEHFTVKEITELLKLVKPPLVKSTIEMIRDLIRLQTVTESKPNEKEGEKIYTVEDLDEVLVQQENLPVEEAQNGENGWVKTSIDINSWNKCPLGLLPFQSKVNCHLPDDLTWKKKPSSRKEKTILLIQHSKDMKRLRET